MTICTKLGWNSQNAPHTDCVYEIDLKPMSARLLGHLTPVEAEQQLQSLRRMDDRSRRASQ